MCTQMEKYVVLLPKHHDPKLTVNSLLFIIKGYYKDR